MGKTEGKEKMLVKGGLPTLLICGFGGGFIYLLPYLSGTWGPDLAKALNASTTEIGTMVTMFGIINCLLYLPSGLLADKFSSKKLIVFSLLATGILGFIYAAFPPMPVMYILHILLGLTSTFTFWSVCVNTIRAISSEKAQGTVYSIWYILKGGSVGIAGLVAVPLVSSIAGTMGIRAVVILYAALTFVSGIFALFFLKDVKITGANEFHIKDVKKLFKYPALWIVGIAAMAVWIVYICCFQMPKYLIDIYGMDSGSAGLWKMLACQILPFPAAALSGVIADKLCKSKMQFISIMLVLQTIMAVLFLVVPTNTAPWVPILMFVLLNQFMVGAVAIIFSVISELKIPFAISGTAAGILSFLYYLPETFGYVVTGNFVNNGSNAEGVLNASTIGQFRNVFIFMLAFCVVGTVAIYVARVIAKHTKAVDEPQPAVATADGSIEAPTVALDSVEVANVEETTETVEIKDEDIETTEQILEEPVDKAIDEVKEEAPVEDADNKASE